MSARLRMPRSPGGFAAGILALGALGIAMLASTAGGQEALRNASSFDVVDIYVDSARPLAAWQFELEEAGGRMQVVGIEGGEAAPYAAPPYYDREAVAEGTADRIIVAAFSTRAPDDLPVGRTRVASVHVRLEGGTPPSYELTLIAAGAADGSRIDAEIDFDTRNGR